ncbi:unnamed protein product [Urochloa humidicola]
MIGIGAVPPLFLVAAAVLAMPETPRWLVLHGHSDEAARVLARTSSGDANRHLMEILTSVKNASAGAAGVSSPPAPSTSVWRDILLRPTPAVRTAGVPTSLWRGGADPLRAAGVSPRRRHLPARRDRRHHPPRRRQDGDRHRPAFPRRPPRPPAHAARERRRHGGVAPAARPLDVDASACGERGGGVHCGVLAEVRAGAMDVRVGDPAPAAARAGYGHRDAVHRVMSAAVGMSFISPCMRRWGWPGASTSSRRCWRRRGCSCTCACRRRRGGA